MTELFIKKQTEKIYKLLAENYPNPKPALNYKSDFQLLIATILSAQCTDERVNKVTELLFELYPDAKSFAECDLEDLEKHIYSTGYYKQKAKNIKACCEELVKKWNSQVPSNFDDLVKLPGVGRKTASVVAGNAFNIPAIAVDTHVKRIVNLLGLSDSKNADVIELNLKMLLPQKYWVSFSHLLANHGKKICIAQRPKCNICFLSKYCPSKKY